MEAGEREPLTLALERLGYSMMAAGRPVDLAAVLDGIIEGSERRLWKAVPFLVERAGDGGADGRLAAVLDPDAFLGPRVEPQTRLARFAFLAAALAVMDDEDGTRAWRGRLRAALARAWDGLAGLPPGTLGRPHPAAAALAAVLGAGGARPGLDGLVARAGEWFPALEDQRDEYRMQKRIRSLEDRLALTDRLRLQREREVRLALARLFPPRQREIIEKVLSGLPLTKTEYEYHVRVVKRKLGAIAVLGELAGEALRARPVREGAAGPQAGH